MSEPNNYSKMACSFSFKTIKMKTSESNLFALTHYLKFQLPISLSHSLSHTHSLTAPLSHSPNSEK